MAKGLLHHVEINVSDLHRSIAFWGWLLSELGYEEYQKWEKGRSWKLGDTYIVFVQTEEKFLNVPYHRRHVGLNHLAFHAESRQQVDEMTTKLKEMGVSILYEEKHPFAGGENYYAVFFEDPDRIKVELVAPNITLCFYKQEHLPALASFYLPEDQKQFTGMPDESLQKASEDQHRHAVVILAGEIPVGFFILYDGDEIASYSDNPNVLLLRAFSINHNEQGKGYAKMGLAHLQQFVRNNFPHIEEVILAVNARNIPAKSLYLKCGFVDDGQTRMGSIGMQHVLRLLII